MKKLSAFSLIELSVVVVIVGLLLAAVSQGGKIIKQTKLKTARTLTQSSPVASAADLIVWYETSLESSFDSSVESGTAIATWYDNNPHTNDVNNATQSTSGYKPIFYQNIFNGAIPAVRFDGTDDLMTLDGSLMTNSNYTVFIVEQRRIANSSWLPMIGGTTNTTNYNFNLSYQSNTVVSHGHYGSSATYAVTGYSTPTPRIHTAMFSTVNGKSIWLNGVSKVSNNAQTTALASYAGTALGRFNFSGTNYFFNGDLAEIIIFNRALRTEERRLIEVYLSKKYGISLT